MAAVPGGLERILVVVDAGGGSTMNLGASLVLRNEVHRYLKPCIGHLREFVDTIIVLDDASDDGTQEWLRENADEQLAVAYLDAPCFYKHEGAIRDKLLALTLSANVTHIVSIDADELLSDGAELRARLEAEPEQPVWTLEMCEVWRADANAMYVRMDGGWRSHAVPFVWKEPPKGVRYTMRDRALACGRVPTQVLSAGRAKPTNTSLLHFGWSNPAERAARIARYKTHDGGKFHASSHLRSLEWPDSKMALRQRPWPEGEVFEQLRERFMVSA